MKMKQKSFSLFLPLSTTKTLDIIHKISIKDSEGWREGKPARGLRAPRNDRVVTFLGFCIASYIPDVELKKPETQKTNRHR